MSQVDLSRQVLESFTDDNGDRGEGDFNLASSGDVGSCVRASASSSVSVADGGRSDRLPPAAHHHSGFGSTASSASSSSSTSTSAVHHESNYGILERCGRWLMAIPRDDVVALQQTSEYREFLSAFDKLGEAHRRTVTLERQHLLMESEDEELAEYSANGPANLPNFSTSSHALHPSSPAANACISPSIATIQPPPLASHPLSPVSALRRRRYSFLQHLAVDDVLLRVFEFIDCSSLVRTGTTCHRFRELATRSAEQRTQRLADGRLLRSAMRMLRAQEQIEGVGPREGATVVPIPMLGLRRRVRVAGAGDPEYNGIYFCTGSNGNGFLFTKPRSPERRVRVPPNDAGDGDRDDGNNLPALDVMHQLVELDGVGGVPVGDAHHHMGGGEGEDGNNGIAFFAVNGAVGLDVNLVAADEDNDGVNRENGRNGEREDSVDILFGDEPNRSRLLRCVIAKRFSNETILWYMSKEIEDGTTHQISQNFSFWAKLLVTGDAPPDVCQYPSQSSILSRNGEPAWQPLTNTVDVIPPIVELLDG